MYSNYTAMPMNRYQSSDLSSSYSSMPVSSSYYSDNGDRFVGGFAFPFLLGGVTGAAIAPAFWRPGYQPYPPRPYPQPYPPYPPRPYPYYRPF